MGLPTNADGSLRAFTPSEVADMKILTTNVRDGSHPTHTREYGQSTIRATYFCDPGSFDNFLIWMMGAAVTYQSADGRTRISRLMPQTYPNYPEFACTKLERAGGHAPSGEIQAVGGTAVNVPQYNRLRCDFLFEHVPYALKSDADIGFDETRRYLQTLPSRMDVDYISYPGSVVRYLRTDGGTGKPNKQQIQVNVAFPQVQGEVARKWVRVPETAWGNGTVLWNRVYGDIEAGTEPYSGTVNKFDFLGYPSGTLLLLAPEEEYKRDPLGQGYAWDLTFRWLFKPRGHSYFYYQDPPSDAMGFTDASGYYFAGRGNTYYATENLPDGVALFNARDHSQLFNLY